MAFRTMGIWPFDPAVILNQLFLSKTNILSVQPPQPQSPQDTSNSLRSIKQRALFINLKMSAEKCVARVIMHKVGEAHVREQSTQ